MNSPYVVGSIKTLCNDLRTNNTLYILDALKYSMNRVADDIASLRMKMSSPYVFSE